MKYVSFDGTTDIELKNCPFCNTDPEVKYTGNEATKTRTIQIKCPKCLVSRIDRTRLFTFKFLENVAVKQWNQRRHGD